MSEYMFGVSRQKPAARTARRMDQIAKREGAYLVEAMLPGTGYQRWFCAPNLGSPFDGDRARRVHAALVAECLVTDGSYDLAKSRSRR